MRLLDLFEDYKNSVLYHATNISAACKILDSNSMISKSSHRISNKLVKGLSFTRDIRFAKYHLGTNPGVIFVVDWEKLKHNYKFIQIDYWQDITKKQKGLYTKDKIFDEAEEFLIGDLLNFDRYLVKILVPENMRQNILDDIEQQKDTAMYKLGGRLSSENIHIGWLTCTDIILQHPKVEYFK